MAAVDVWGIKREYRPRGSNWALKEERQYRTGQEESHNKAMIISPIRGEAPTEAIYIKIVQ